MVYDKKYWSENEYTHKNGTPYNGYVGIFERNGYVYDTEELLIKRDSYSAEINSSHFNYDRILDEEIELPYEKVDVQFAANDFLSTSTLKDILLKLQANNDYIFKNAIISNTALPAATKVDVLATKYSSHLEFVDVNGDTHKTVTSANKSLIEQAFVINSNTSSVQSGDSYVLKVGETPKEKYDTFHRIPRVTRIYDLVNGVLSQHNLARERTTNTALDPTFYEQYDSEGNVSTPRFNFNEITHVDMKIVRVEATETGRKLHLIVLLVFKDKVVLFKYVYFQDDKDVSQKTATDARYDETEHGEVDFNEGTTDLLVLETVDPSNKNSMKFLSLRDVELNSNYMYLVDDKLNMVLRYDITYLLNDESEFAWDLDSIKLVDNMSGDGDITDPIYFNKPVAIAVDENYVYVADSGNNCIKKYSSSFDYKATIRNGQFINHDIQSVAVNPYSITMEDGTKLEEGTLWVFSVSGTHVYVTVIDSTNTTVYSKQIEKIDLVKDKYTWDEEFKSVKFSFTNSNYYYLCTNKRVYKFHLSKPLYPFASLSYFRQRSMATSMQWSSYDVAWHEIPEEITWDQHPEKTSMEVLDNRAFCICGIDSSATIEYDAGRDEDGEKIPHTGNKQEQFEGDLILHIGNLYDQSLVDTYIKENGCEFNEIPSVELAKMIRSSGIFIYVEPTTYISSLSTGNMPCFVDDDLQDVKVDEYVNSITFNAHIYKVIYNLVNIKNSLLGKFQGAYNTDNVMVFDQLILDNFFQQLKLTNKDDYFIHDNEPSNIIVNRVFENVWNIQDSILRKMKAKYMSVPSFTNGTFRII